MSDLQILVDRPNIHTIKVQNPLERVVCIKCKGLGQRTITDYHNTNALWLGGLYYAYHMVTCPDCRGLGHWKPISSAELTSPVANWVMQRV